ncbi:MAG: EamA family transporter [Xanthobacteraceae bacterium]
MYGVLLAGICAVNEGFAQTTFKLSVTAGKLRFFWISAGIGFFIIDAVLYSMALQFLNVNVAFSIGALGMVSIAAMSKWVLKEKITPIRWAGIFLIMGGTVVIVSQI